MIQNHRLGFDLRPDFSFTLMKLDGEPTPLADGRAQLLSGASDLLSSAAAGLSISNTQSIETALGIAQRVTATAEFGPLQARLTIDQYKEWPDSFIFQWAFRNQSNRTLPIQSLASPILKLRPVLTQNLWTLQGVAVEWGQDFAFKLPKDFVRENYTGHTDHGEGGGIPLIYGWNDQIGLALAHIEPEQKLCYLPVKAENGGVSFSLEDREGAQLAPGEALHSSRVLISIHDGDFFEPLALYQQIMARQGQSAPQANEEDYQPAWCSWGYEFDVRPEEMTGVLPKLKEMDLRWLTLDDRWFDHYGDWNPRTDTFPGGTQQMREMVEQIHAAGAYAQLWWYPLCVEDGTGDWDGFEYGTSAVLAQHPDWLVLNPDGSVARNNRGLAILCPGLPAVQDYTIAQVERFIRDWDFDGHKLDNIYTVPPCFNPAHHHRHPDESLRGFAEVYRKIFEVTRGLKPHSVTQICPCGTQITHTLIPALDQAVTADPTSSAQIRQRIKFYKALLGPRFPVFADHVELSDQGIDFASEIGTGGIPATKFVWPEEDALHPRLSEWWGLSPEKEALWKKWLDIASRHRLAEGEYLNLYDLAFDAPEAHVVLKDGKLYYAFYTPHYGETYEGRLVLRGLQSMRYSLYDYVNGNNLGQVNGPVAEIKSNFKSALLIRATPMA